MSPHEYNSAHATAQGSVDLTFAVRAGRTRLVKRLVNSPFVVQRCFYLDGRLEDMAYVFLANPTAGIFQGDHQCIAVNVEAGAKAHVTNQSATKVHTMPEGSASQETQLTVGDGAYLEYLPEPLIPFKGSRFSQSTTITVAPTGTLLYWEILAPGRVARGESLAYEWLENRLTIRTPEGVPTYHEAYRLEPRLESPHSLAILGRSDTPTLGTLVIVSKSSVDGQAMADKCRQVVESGSGDQDDKIVGLSCLPCGAGVGVKMIGTETQAVKSVLKALASGARKLLTGAELPESRKY